MIKLDQLRYFVEAVQCGSISAAARKVHLAQPAFSTQIRSLEEDLGVRLLDRSAKGVQLTESGERLYHGALSLFRHAEQVREETVSVMGELAGEVRIVLASSVAPLLAGQLFWETQQRYPQIRLVILDLMRVAGDNLVTSRQVDFALLPNVTTLLGAATEPVIAQDLYLVGRTPPDASRGEVDFHDLGTYPLVMGGRKNQLRIDLENTAAREGCRIRVAIEQDSMSVFRSIILSGPAYTIVPYSAFATEIGEGVLTATRIVNPVMERTLSFAWHESSKLSSSASAVMELLRMKIVEMVEKGGLRGRLL
jgi:LysR family nitrogen assimilation transcriptional regulator